VLEIHLIIRATLADALRDEYVTRNVALTANVSQPPSVRMPEPQSWTADQLQRSCGRRLGTDCSLRSGRSP
jgi:hypothetical protein